MGKAKSQQSHYKTAAPMTEDFNFESAQVLNGLSRTEHMSARADQHQVLFKLIK